MEAAISILWFLLPIVVATALTRRWPSAMRDVSRSLTLAVGTVLLASIISGVARVTFRTGEIHRWLAHGLLLLVWNTVTFAVGFHLAWFPARPIRAMARSFGVVILLGIVFLASITGYSRPEPGPSHEITMTRFYVLHCGLLPLASVVLVAWWFLEVEAGRHDRASAS